jgi:hypothetical protein
MNHKTSPLILIFIFTLLLMACTAKKTATPTESLPTSTVRPTEIAPTAPSGGQPVSVVFVKEGDIKVWDQTSDQSETLFSAGDVISLSVSDDNQVIAFIRRSVVRQSDIEWYEQSELWAINRNGEAPRQLLSAEGLRELIQASERDSSAFLQMEWIPHTHSLLFSGTKYIVQGEGLSHAYPQGVFLVESGTGSITALFDMDRSLRFSASPDGREIALMSTSGLSFINTDGSNWRPEVLAYPDVSVTGSVFPSGVWTEDNRAFLITGFIESGSPGVLNFNLWLVFADGSTIDSLAGITADSHPASVTFSPDGKHASYHRWPDPAWFITPLAFEVGPLAIPSATEMGYANLHWSPSGDAFAINGEALTRLCPDATQNTDVCGDPINLEGTAAVIQWIDSSTFLYLTREPEKLFLGRLDGTDLLIVTWLPGEYPGAGSFSVVK